MKLLHISDIHLGAKFVFLGTNASKYRFELIKTFESIANVIEDQKVEVLVISGDLFDLPYPSKTTVEIVQKLFRKITSSGVYIVLVPGNHDFLAKGSVYEDGSLKVGDKVLIFDNVAEKTKVLEDKKIVFYHSYDNSKLPSKIQKENDDPLPGSKSQKNYDDYKHIAISHSGVDIRGDKAMGEISAQDIASSGFDYIAFGDWHGLLDYSAGDVKACYPGSLEPLAIDQIKSGNGVLVEIEQKVSAKPLRIGRFACVSLEIEIDEKKRSVLELLEKAIEGLLDQNIKKENLILSVSIVGTRDQAKFINVEELEGYFQDKVFSIQIKDQMRIELMKDSKNDVTNSFMISFLMNIDKRTDIEPEMKELVKVKAFEIIQGQ